MRPFGKLFPFDDPGQPEDDNGWPASDTGAAADPAGPVDSLAVTEPEARRGTPGTGTPISTPPVSLPIEPASPTAFTITINWDASVALAPSGFTTDILAAVNFLETQFTNPATITVNVGYEEVAGNALDGGDLGESLSNMASVSYANLVSAVAGSATTAADASVVASLPATNPIGGSNDWVTTAQAKALGLPASVLSGTDGGSVDGSVGFGRASEFTYGDTNASGSVAAGTYDFFATALHELTEIMGRQMLTGSAEHGSLNSYTLLDLLHYSGPGARDFSQFTPGYFSADGGTTNLGGFNTSAGGDAGDWASSVANDPFDAFASSGTFEAVSANDLTEMDALGWKPAGSGGSTAPVTPPQTSPAFPAIGLPMAPTFTSPFFPLFSPFSPFLPFTATTPTRPASPAFSPPTGIAFAPEPKYLAYALAGTGLSAGSPLAAVAAAGGTAGDTLRYTLNGADAASFDLVPTNDGAALLAGPDGVAGASGGALHALTVTVTDETVSGNPTVTAPINVVAGSAVIRLSSLPGIVASAPTFIYGSGGNDTLDGSGMTGTLYFDGGAGGDTMTGGSGVNVYEYGGAQDSSGSGAEVITNFSAALDLVDLTGVGGLFAIVGALDPTAATIAAGSVAWRTSGGNTFVYANTSDTAEALFAANLTIELRGTIALTSANFAHS
jgi:hypothetical protein